MNWKKLFLAFALMAAAGSGAASAAETCELVYKTCLDFGRKNIGPGGSSIGPTDAGAATDCWDEQKVYRCFQDWQNTTCPDESLLTTNYGFTLVKQTDVPVYYQSYYQYPSTKYTSKRSTGEMVAYTSTYSRFDGYTVDCPTSQYIEDACADNENCNLEVLTGYDCMAQAPYKNGDNPWTITDPSTVSSETYSPSYTASTGVINRSSSGVYNESKSRWICTTDVNSTCTQTDISQCTKMGTECAEGAYDPNLPSVEPLGRCSSGVTYYECPLNTTTTCDSDIKSCSDPFSSNPIYHDVITDVEIGRKVQYTCYADDPTVTCQRPGGYDTCQFSYYECLKSDPNMLPSENIVDGRSYGTCVDWVDHYICPSEVVVSCDGPLVDCGPGQQVSQDVDAGGNVYHIVDEYICYNGDIKDSCGENTSHNYYGCEKIGFTCHKRDPNNVVNPDPVYGDCIDWTDEWVCPNDATYTCDSTLDDCRAPVVRPGSEQTSTNGTTPLGSNIQVGRIDDYVCWTGGVNEVCDPEVIDHTGCNHTGYTCHATDPEKATPNIVDGRDYGNCISWTDNWVCASAVSTTCDSGYTDCAPPTVVEGSVVKDPNGVIVDWTEEYVCYTGDYIENCDDLTETADIHECAITGFSCLVRDPNKAPDPVYGDCVKWIDRYACGHLQYTKCDTDFEVCTSSSPLEKEYNADGTEILSREVEYCYTDEINQSQCVLEDDKCYVYDEGSNCENKITQRAENYQACIDGGDTASTCNTKYPEPTCKTEVACPTGQRLGVDCQLDWDAYDIAMAACLADPGKTLNDCEAVTLPACKPEEHDYIDCPHSGFTCKKWDYNLTAAEANANMFEGRNYGFCVEWSDRYTCPQYQSKDCSQTINEAECGDLGYVVVDHVQDGQAVEYTTVLECVESNAPDCVMDPSCKLVEVDCVASDGGLCTEKKQVWSCTENRTDCVKWNNTCAYPTALDFGRENTSENNIGEFIAQASISKMVQENTSFVANEIRIFEGKDSYCQVFDQTNITAMIVAATAIAVYTGYLEPEAIFWAAMLTMVADLDCCKVDHSAMTQGKESCATNGDCEAGYDQNMLEMLICSEDEVELAKSRGSNHVVGALGHHCELGILGFCLQYKYAFCEFDNLFARLVQEQGRQQIADALAQDATGAVEESVAFNYYTATVGGGWNLYTVNGNKIAFWSWDQACQNSDLLLNPPADIDNYFPPVCPYTDEVYVASCEGDVCINLPVSPLDNSGSNGSYTDYTVTVVDAFVKESLAVNRRIFVSGQCDSSTKACGYKLHAYPATGGTSVAIGYDMSWVTNTNNPGWSQFEYDIGDHVVVPYEYTGGTASLTEIKMKIDGTEYAMPKDTGGAEVAVGPLTFIGSCSDRFYSCSFRVYKTLVIELIPWGGSKDPNCRGFTPDEIEVLDFGAMDLEEWIATILPEEPDEDALLAEAQDSVQTEKDALLNGARQSGGSAKVVYWTGVTAHPDEEVVFRAVSKIVISDDIEETFYKVNVNWDDGSPFESMSFSSGGFKASKTYGTASGRDGFNVRFAFYANSGRVYETSVRIIVGLGSDTPEVENQLGGGVIDLTDFAIKADSASGLKKATGG